MSRTDPSLTKLLVRHTRANKFLGSTGEWTNTAETAFNFPNALNAIHACLLSGANEVEFVLRFNGDKADRCLRLKVA